MEYTRTCPKCDLKLQIEEFSENVAIKYDGIVVTECPRCETPLDFVDGSLIEKEE